MIKPLSRPKMTRDELMAKVAGQMIPSPVYLVGIRGYYRDTMGQAGANDIGIYDDAIFLVTPSTFFPFNANTDPSKSRAGIAKLIPGIHIYKKGKHGISRPGGGYDALRPATPDESLPVTRDGKTGVHKGVAINIHKGSFNSTSSEGCQTIYPDQWLHFIREVYQAMDREGQKTIPYLLIENI